MAIGQSGKTTEKVKVGVMSVLEGRAFPAKKAAGAKTLRRKHVWHVQ